MKNQPLMKDMASVLVLFLIGGMPVQAHETPPSNAISCAQFAKMAQEDEAKQEENLRDRRVEVRRRVRDTTDADALAGYWRLKIYCGGN